MTLPVAEAVLLGQRARTEELLGARLPDAWPGRALVERAFFASLDLIRSAPDKKLWGNRVMITREENRRVVGSVVFHGAPGPDGIVEVAYGVEQESQLKGYARESVPACVDWALNQPGAIAVRATTPPWHIASRRVLDRCGLQVIGTEMSDAFGDLVLYERRLPCEPSLSTSSGAIG